MDYLARRVIFNNILEPGESLRRPLTKVRGKIDESGRYVFGEYGKGIIESAAKDLGVTIPAGLFTSGGALSDADLRFVYDMYHWKYQIQFDFDMPELFKLLGAKTEDEWGAVLANAGSLSKFKSVMADVIDAQYLKNYRTKNKMITSLQQMMGKKTNTRVTANAMVELVDKLITNIAARDNKVRAKMWTNIALKWLKGGGAAIPIEFAKATGNMLTAYNNASLDDLLMRVYESVEEFLPEERIQKIMEKLPGMSSSDRAKLFVAHIMEDKPTGSPELNRLFKDIKPFFKDMAYFKGLELPPGVGGMFRKVLRKISTDATVRDLMNSGEHGRRISAGLGEEAADVWNTYLMMSRYTRPAGEAAYSLREVLNGTFTRLSEEPGSLLSPVDISKPSQVLDALARLSAEAENDSIEQRVLQALYNEIYYINEYMVARVEGRAMPPPLFLSKHGMMDNIQQWMSKNELFVSDFSRLNTAMDGWREHMKGAYGRYNKLLVNMPDEVAQVLKKVTDDVIVMKKEAMSTATYGGAVHGVNMNDALHDTQNKMLDYESYNNLDNIMRSIFPFWMFFSRSIPYWFGVIAKHPEIAAFYFRYVKYSGLTAARAGYTNRYGDPLPSIRGYMKIPGMEMWVNPTSFTLMKTIFPVSYDTETEDNEDALSSALQHVYSESEMRGLSMLPIWTFLVNQLGAKSVYSNPSLGYEALNLFLPMQYISHPYFERSLMAKMRSGWAKDLIPVLLNPQASFEDALIRRQILLDMLDDIKNMADETKKWDRIKPVAELFKNKSLSEMQESPLWLSAKAEYEDTQYWSRLTQALTGFYPKYVDPLMPEIIELRDAENTLKWAINDELKAKAFDLAPSPDERYDALIEAKFSTPEGWASNAYDVINFVIDPITGKQAEDPVRRQELIAQQFLIDAQTEAYYASIKALITWRDGKLAALPIGASWDAKQPIYIEYSEALEKIKSSSDYYFADRPYYAWVKPANKIYTHFRDDWFYNINSTYPKWDESGSEDWKTYQERIKIWQESLPLISQAMRPAFEANLVVIMNQIPEDDSRRQDVSQIVSKLLGESTVDGYAQWKKDKDGIYEAIDAAFVDLIGMQEWYDIYDKNLGAMGVQKLQGEHLKKYPPPTSKDIIEWLKINYPNRFADAEVIEAVDGRKIYKSVPDRAESEASRLDKMEQETWKYLAIMGIGTRQDDFRDTFSRLGGDLNTFKVWYEIPDRTQWDGLEKFHDLLAKTTEYLGYTKLPEDVQAEFAKAEDINKNIYENDETLLFGSELVSTHNYYYQSLRTASKQKAWAKANPDLYKKYFLEYWNFRDAFTAKYPLWAKYYNASGYAWAIKKGLLEPLPEPSSIASPELQTQLNINTNVATTAGETAAGLPVSDTGIISGITPQDIEEVSSSYKPANTHWKFRWYVTGFKRRKWKSVGAWNSYYGRNYTPSPYYWAFLSQYVPLGMRATWDAIGLLIPKKIGGGGVGGKP
jgi:hypothetical protein